MTENRERSFELFEEYAGLKQHDIVKGVYQGKNFSGEIKSFTHYQDSGEVVANVSPGHGSEVYGDIHVDPATLSIQMRPGKIFRPGKITRE
jgi:hypothetical protein